MTSRSLLEVSAQVSEYWISPVSARWAMTIPPRAPAARNNVPRRSRVSPCNRLTARPALAVPRSTPLGSSVTLIRLSAMLPQVPFEPTDYFQEYVETTDIVPFRKAINRRPRNDAGNPAATEFTKSEPKELELFGNVGGF